ncbi:MAG: dTDP-4-dehydrorhamnose reductase [Gammaproteobacteria bacterium]
MKVLVTGGSGQLGHEVVRCLRLHDSDVIVPTLDELDLMTPESIDTVIAQHRPDQVINCAAYTQVDKAESQPQAAFMINRDAAGRLAGAVASTGGRLLHVSTDFVFDGKQQTPYRESDPAHPMSVYGRSKREGEEAVMRALPGAVILRTAWLYGVHGHNFVKTMLRLAREGKPLRVVADQRGTPTWAADVASVILQLLGSGASGLFHYTSAGSTSWHGFARAILDEAAEVGFDVRTRHVEPIPATDYPTPAVRPAYSVLDTGKIESQLSLSIPDWRDSLKKMLEELHTCPDCL